MSLTTLKAKVKAAGFTAVHGNVSKKGKRLYEFSCEDHADMMSCCGVAELASFQIQEKDSNYDDHWENDLPKKGSIAYDALRVAIAEEMVAIKNRISIGKKKGQSKIKLSIPVTRGIVFTTNGDDNCAILEAALRLIPEHYKAVSKTINPSSRNIITIWVGKM